MGDMKMIRRQLYLPLTLSRELKNCSLRLKISESEILRRALSQYLEQEKRRKTSPEQNPVLKAMGIFEGGPDCFEAGEKHDEIIYGPMKRGTGR
ncbi:MAG: ribbon-helix-helix domain-containing protein [Armatimonadetes bacterium]|nr:ribbon-helix-helix domain-containing protein [Armatimonadota bacterium]